jgi:hypothetical protein
MFKVKKHVISSDLKKKFASHKKKVEERKNGFDDGNESGKKMGSNLLRSLP